MKKIFCILLMSGLMFSMYNCTSNNTRSNNNKENNKNNSDTNIEVLNKAEFSKVTETKLFGGFKFGMVDSEVDSVIKALGNENKLALSDYINDDAAPIEDYDIYNSSYELWLDYDHKMYLSFTPKYLDGHLSEMFYSIKVANIDRKKYKEKPYVMLARYFQNTERGATFKKIGMIDDKDSLFFYCKDNLVVTFQPSNNDEGIMIYYNAPEAKALENSKKSDKQ